MSPKEDTPEEHDSNNITTMTEDGEGEQSTPIKNSVSKVENEHFGHTKNATSASVANRKSRLSSIFLGAKLDPSNQKEMAGEERHSETDTNGSAGTPPLTFPRRLCRFSLQFYQQYEFLILIIISICLARAYPPLGAEYLQPQITSTWIAVVFIFCKWPQQDV
jgi:hypothetical protein